MLSSRVKDNNGKITEHSSGAKAPAAKEFSTEDKFEELNIDTDSGFISGPQNQSSPDLLEESSSQLDNRSSATSTHLTSSEHKVLNRETVDSAFDSGLILDTEEPEDSKMIIDSAAKFDINAGFCNLSIKDGSGVNNLNRFTSTSSSQQQEQQQLPNSDQSSKAKVPVNMEFSSMQPVIDLYTYWEVCYQQDQDGDTYLHAMAMHDDPAYTNFVIQLAPNAVFLNIMNRQRLTALHYAVLVNHAANVRLLTIGGADVTIQDNEGNTPLHIACRNGYMECVRALTVPIKDSEVSDFYSHINIRNRHAPPAVLPQALDTKNAEGLLCTHLATYYKHPDILHHLVQCGANINAGEGKSGEAPIHLALRVRDETLIKFMLVNFRGLLDINKKLYNQRTAYQVATINKQWSVVRLLEEYGAARLDLSEESDVETEVSDSEPDEEFMAQVTN